MERKVRVLEAVVVVALAIVSLHCTVAEEIPALTGTDVTLPCRVDVGKCGTLHSVKWYRDTSRIYVFSKTGQVSRAEGDATERMTVEYNETVNEAFLKISNVQVQDEATYKCEITYLDVRENCDVVQIVKIHTLVYPTSIRILGNDGASITNATKLEPKDEGSETEVTCEALGGKPVPTISWYNGSTLMSRASDTKQSDANGVGNATSKLRLTLSRGDLNSRYECRVESEALGPEPIISWITFDVHVRPTKMVLRGVEDHVLAGENVYLRCDVLGALPPAVVKWYNGSIPITEQHIITTNQDLADDGTYNTRSTLNFTASRWENGKSIYCTAYNEVMKTRHDPDMKELVIIDVRYPPVIQVSSNRTVLREGDRIMLSCTYYANPQELLDATWRKDGKRLTKVPGKHEFGDKDTPSLQITGISREDMGEYTCWLKNNVGESESEESIFLDVHYPPQVEVIMEPSAPVKAGDRGNVTLECNVTSGNPPALKKVRWLLGGDIMTELPECNYNQSATTNESLGGPFCGIDPSILSLIKVEESFAGNYTCQGENEAGYGPESDPQELVVYYPPTPAKLLFYPLRVVKNFSVNLECTVDHPGRPNNVTYMWYRGNNKFLNVTVSNWTIPQASLRTRSNFTCIAKNEGGESAPATVKIEVFAPPAFLPSKLGKDKLVPYKGVLYSSSNISLTCRIECYPLCSIEWLKNDNLIKFERNRNYYKIESNHSADYNKNDFESIESTLVWNMTFQQQLIKGAPNANYTCRSKNHLGNKINFTTEIAVDYPPEDIILSKSRVDVKENEIPDRVKCSGSGHPNLFYAWKKVGTSEYISKSQTLELPKLKRDDDGNYVCEASNKYGIETASVRFNVLYKPGCKIESEYKDGNKALLCHATANPQNVTFRWKIRESNDTVEDEDIVNEGLDSFLILDTSVDVLRTYQCIATNAVGSSVPCEKTVEGMLPWYKRLGDNLILIIAAVVIIILCVIIVCIVIILLCRRKRLNTKSPNPFSTEDKMRLGAAPPVGGSAGPTAANDPDRGFYENLPFHGMQNPPNKTNGTTASASDTYIF